jgi:hypothetical protein
MTYEALVITLGFAVDLIALYFLVGIWKDDRLMRIAAEQSLKAQLEYLGLRRAWYAQRTAAAKKKIDVGRPGTEAVGTSDGDSANAV